ncbi:BadF/BadG/BcrA/BcrD ATPase family protein [Sulfitobacter pacificus]|uniref:BadF/BadG/BcrA/BcrD ATPase family protein n=1 Tax=Sulfitobacter pacificus TaxID=1499314 RepID=UPI00360888D2
MFCPSQPLLIGVDGGGTGCRVAIGTHVEGVLGRAEGGSANATSNFEKTIENVTSTVEKAVVAAGISLEVLSDARAHLGLAGAISDEDKLRVSRALPYAESVVTDDRATTVFGALRGDDGYVVSVGTGTIVGGSTAGAFRFVGGWGFQVSDHGSGAWLGRNILEQVLLGYDGLLESSALTETVFSQFDNDPSKIVAFCSAATPGAFATLAPAIVAGAGRGDPIGKDLMARGAGYLMQGLARLGFQAGDSLCLIGGLGPHYADYFTAGSLKGRIPAKGSALDGAFALARSGKTKLRGHK